MKQSMYAIFEIGWEYNDSTYNRRAGTPIKLYATTDEAIVAKEKLEKKARAAHSKYEMYDDETLKPITQFYEIIEIEVA